MKKATVPKKIPISFHVITFLSKVASGNDSPTTAIIKAMAVPIGIPFATNTSITGTIPAALAYIGTARITERGTAYQLSFDIYCSKKPSGTKPCIKSTYTYTYKDIDKYAAYYLPRITDNGWQSFYKGCMVFFPFLALY